MKLWRWFVGQVARLRRSVVGVVAAGSQPQHEDDRIAAADEPAPGPPAHWVERVRRGAPGLLEPSLRRRGEPVEPPSANRVALSQTELEPEPESLEEPERGYVRTEPTVAAQRPEAPVRAPLLRRVLRRAPAQPVHGRAAVEVASASVTNDVPPRLETASRRMGEPAASPQAEEQRLVGETGRAPAPPQSLADEHSQGPPVPDKPGPSQGPPMPGKTVRFQAPPVPDKPERFTRRSEVVAFEAASPDRPVEAGVAPPSAKNVLHAELALDETGSERAWKRSVPSPAPRRAAERRLEPAPTPPSPLRASSLERESPPRRRTEPLSELARHPWPELPPPLDQPDSEVEAALRAWEHQRRLDHEQTRL
jgi:hypothetical protein